MLHGDLLRIEHAGRTSWRLLRSSQGHAPDDDDDDDYKCRGALVTEGWSNIFADQQFLELINQPLHVHLTTM